MSDHFPQILHLPSGTQFHEPPSIEGYLDRIKPNTQIKQAVYLVTHGGNLFSLSPSRAHPPSHPGIQGKGRKVEDEVKRGAKQIMEAIGASDLRSIMAVRKAFQMVPQHRHDPPGASSTKAKGKKAVGEDEWASTWAMEPEVEGLQSEVEEDEGGDEGLAKAADKGRLRTRRSFELLLDSGNVVRFEVCILLFLVLSPSVEFMQAYSSRVALEWINCLRDLIRYWKHRHRIDAREKMDLAQVGSRRPRLTPQMHHPKDKHDIPPEPPADPDANLPALGSLYNWCVLDGCKSIVKDGKVYTRRGLRGQYKQVPINFVISEVLSFSR
jgi:hypothetical protein